MIEHFKKWNKWRKFNTNSKFYKLLVLFKIVVSPSFNTFITKRECDKSYEELLKKLLEGDE